MSSEPFREPFTHDDYHVGWICGLPFESAVATALLDEEHPPLDQEPGDTNVYRLGRFGQHNVVIGCLPLGTIGEIPTTAVAKDMLRNFPNIRIGLMVGIGGGAPGPPNEDAENDIRLGDIVVSKPGPGHGGVIQYDYEKTMSEGELMNIGYLNRPPNVLLTALSNLLSQIELRGTMIPHHLADMGKKHPRSREAWQYQGIENDQLSVENPRHTDIDRSCEDLLCTEVIRKPRSNTDPVVHCGLIASGNQIMTDGVTRQKLRNKHGVLCFDTEAAGLDSNFPCLVIRGICDYSDSHRSPRWQPYAAAASAAFAKDLLQVIPTAQLERTERAAVITGTMEEEFGKSSDERKQREKILNWLSPNSTQRAERQLAWELDTGKSFIEDLKFKAWLEGNKDLTTLFCPGLPGVGKTTMASIVANYIRRIHRKKHNVAVASMHFRYNLQGHQTLVHMLRTVFRQLLEAMPSIPDDILSYYLMKTDLDEDDLLELVRDAIRKNEFTFIIIDALDECQQERLSEFLDAIRRLQAMGARLMITSRSIDTIELAMTNVKKCCRLDIRAAREDMEMYIDREFDFSSFYRIPDEPVEIERFKNTVIDSAKGMFIVVRLYINILKNKCTRAEIQEELDHIANDQVSDPVYQAYKKTTQMVGQAFHREWAYRLLSWVFHSRRALNIMELREALAAQTQRDIGRLDMNYAPHDIGKIISSCSGLLSLRPSSEFCHHTAYQYLEEHQDEHPWISKAARDIAVSCLRYLLFDPFSGKSRNDAFLDYAVRFWAEHLQPVQQDPEVRKLAKRFLQTPSLTSSVHYLYSAKERSALDTPLSMEEVQKSGANGLHLAARFGLHTQLHDLLEEASAYEVNSRDHYGKTPLILAVRYGTEDTVDVLLDNRDVDVNAGNRFKSSPLLMASEMGSHGKIRILLSKGKADPNLATINRWTPILRAAVNDQAEVIKLLLEDERTNPNVTDSNGQTALSLAVERGFANVVEVLLQSGRIDMPGPLAVDVFIRALYQGHKQVIEILLRYGFIQTVMSYFHNHGRWLDSDLQQQKIPNRVEGWKIEMFWLAAQNGLSEFILLLLQEGGVDPNRTNSKGESVLMVAVDSRQLEVVRILLEVGSARADLMAENGNTALLLAVAKRDTAMVQLLMELGNADPNQGDDRTYKGISKYPLAYAAAEGLKDIVQLFINSGKVADYRPGLQAAITRRQLPIIRMLLALPNMDPNTQSSTGITALIAAVVEQNIALVQMLLEMKETDVNVQNRKGETAVMHATDMRNADLTRPLVERGADLTMRDRWGDSVLDYAEHRNWLHEVVQLPAAKRQRIE